LGAHREAAAHYKAALQYADFLSVKERAELLDVYADECDLSDLMMDAERAQREALHLWQELERRDKEGRALCHLSEIAIKLNWKSEIERYVNEAIAVLQTLPPSQELARAYSHKSRLHMVAGQYEETIHWGMRAIELAERLGDVETLAHALCNIGATEMSYQHIDAGEAKLERSLQLSLAHGLHNHAGRTYFNLAGAMMIERDYAACLRCLSEGIAYCDQNDIDYWRLGLLGLRARVYLDRGQWLEAEQDIRTAQEFWGTMETRSIVEPILLFLKVRRGDPISPAALDAARELARTTIIVDVSYNLARLFAEVAWLRGDLVQCRSEVELQFKHALQNPQPSRIGSLAYWMWRADAITAPPPDAAEPYATQIAGNWQAAAAMWEKFGCPYEQGMALMDGDEAAQLAALEIFEHLGARPIIEKLKGQMRAQGIRVPRGPRPATRENPFGLTTREMEVLSCLTKGSSNSAIAKQLSLSARTVGHHIASILQKMEVQSRSEAVALALKDKLLQSE
jgi:ATP/maltotriose-dependent transcriptional regulator MalT